MDKITPIDAIAHFSRHTSHWGPFLESFTEKRELVFYELADLGSESASEKDYWIKMGKMMAFDEMKKELEIAASEARAQEEKQPKA